MTDYDVAIIGAGPAGLLTAYTLTENNDNKLKIIVFDKGKDIYNRTCPMRNKAGQSCVNCKPCNIMSGFGGAGTFSDCKLTLSTDGVGGNLADYIGVEKANKYVNKVDKIYSKFDDYRNKRKIIGENYNDVIKDIKDECERLLGINLTYAPTKHLGTDGTYTVMKRLQAYLINKGVKFEFSTDVTNINRDINGEFFITAKLLYLKDNYTTSAKHVVIAPGRSGNAWLKNIANNLNIKTKSNKVDIGVRVEVPAVSVKTLTDNLYDMKLSYVDKYTGDKIRTFCTNPEGFVSEEHYGDLAVVNGHSFADKKSDRTNFALLVTLNDDNLNSDYTRKIVELCNATYKGKIVKQKFNEFSCCVPLGTDKNIKYDTTLKTAVDGNLDLILPKRISSLIKSFIKQLSWITDKRIDNDLTTIYGIEAKFYSDLIEVDNNMQTSIPNLYCIGDGAGITRGITQAASSGIIVAENILNNMR